jgi:mannose-6-phosphate isomerase-like protein (cupin superfamily)
MKAFHSLRASEPQSRSAEHGGVGPIEFRRVLDKADFNAPVDFVDYTVIPPGSTIGLHRHEANEELYFIVAGSPLMRVNGEEARLQPGGFAIVHDGGSHELINDSLGNVEILVIQVKVWPNGATTS